MPTSFPSGGATNALWYLKKRADSRPVNLIRAKKASRRHRPLEKEAVKRYPRRERREVAGIGVRHPLFCALTLILATSLALAGPGTSPALATTTATFDLFSMFPQQILAPSVGKTLTWIPLDTRNIADVSDWVWLSARPESPHFTAFVFPCLVRPSGAEGTARSWALVSCSPGTPEGTVGYIKVTGMRGAETHRLWLKVTALSSLPSLEMSRGDPLMGQGYRDPVRQPFTGKPLL